MRSRRPFISIACQSNSCRPVYDRCDREPEELIDDAECLGAIQPFGVAGLRDEKRSVVARYGFPDQETKLREGDAVLHAPTRWRPGTISAIDRLGGRVEVKRQLKGDEAFPEALGGGLSLRSSDAAMDVPGEGSWPSLIRVQGAALRRLAPKLAGPFVTFTYADGQLAIGTTVLTATEV